jgi:hypothetical protein
VEYTTEQYQSALQQAEEAGDTPAADFFRKRLHSNYKAAMLKASEEGNKDAVAFFQGLLGGAPEPNIAHKGDKKPGDKVPVDLNAPAVQGMTFQYGDEAAAHARAAQDTILGEGPNSYDERYQQSKAYLDAQLARTREEHPIASTAAEIGGALATPGLGGAKAVVTAGKIAARGGKLAKATAELGTGAAVGIDEAALYGSGEGNTLDERKKHALEMVPYGAAGGVLLPGAILAGRGLKALNKIKVREQEAAGRLAARMKDAEETAGIKWSRNSPKHADGAVAGFDKLHNDINVEMDAVIGPLRTKLDPSDIDVPMKERETRTKAWKAIDNARHKKGRISDDDIKAIDDLVGDTQEGQQLLNLVSEKSELHRLIRHGPKGGLSKATDAFVRLGHVPLAGWIAKPVAGTVDAITTGRRTYAKLFMKQNLGTGKAKDVSHLPSQFETDVAARREVQAIKQEEAAQRADEANRNRLAKAEKKAYDKYTGELRKSGKEYQAQRKAEETKEAKVRDALKRFRKEPEATPELPTQSADKLFRDRQRMVANAARAVAKMQKEGVTKAEKAKAPLKKTEVPKDAQGKKIGSEYLYNKAKARITAMQETAKQAKLKHPENRKIVDDAVEELRLAKNDHKKRIEVFKLAVAKGKTLEQREEIRKVLKDLAGYYGKLD